ncbi:MAG: RluA family pseudouridine synthase [Candidatus Dojkabacteria bacterium]|nr:RluA family pseudouridine synthase [Candidatus Dojkabacteria bacterium]
MKKKSGRHKQTVAVTDVRFIGRLDKALALLYPQWSRTWIGRLVHDGAVEINGVLVRKGSRKLHIGDVISVDLKHFNAVSGEMRDTRAITEFGSTGTISAVLPQPEIPLKIIHEDDDVLVVDKPSGMVIHPAYAHRTGTLANAIAGYFVKSGTPLIKRVGLVHRLDKKVSGLVLVAKHDWSLSALSRQFSSEGIAPGRADVSRKAWKYYWAVVGPCTASDLQKKGLRSSRALKIEGYVWRSSADRRIVEFHQGTDTHGIPDTARYALSYATLQKEVSKGYYVVEVRLITGRMHQIRVQMKSLGFPIVGDIQYGGVPWEVEHAIRLRCVRVSYIPPRVYMGLYTKEKLNQAVPAGDQYDVQRTVVSSPVLP